jgi:hypothetical protein
MLPHYPSIVLASERGAEYYVNHDALSMPQVDWHVRAIDNIVNHRSAAKLPQFAEGGYRNADALPPAPANQMMDFSHINSTLTRMNVLLEQLLHQGIQAQAVIGWTQVRELKQSIDRLNNIEK